MSFEEQLQKGFSQLGATVAKQYRQHTPDTDEDIHARVTVKGPHGIFYRLRFRRRFKGPWVESTTKALAQQLGWDITPLGRIQEFAGRVKPKGTTTFDEKFTTEEGEIIGQQAVVAERVQRRPSHRHGMPTGWRQRLHR